MTINKTLEVIRLGARWCAVLAVLLNLQACAGGYKTSFACGEAAGATCMPIDKLDKMIQSGEIEDYDTAYSKCKGKSCSKLEDNILVPSAHNEAFFNGQEDK